MTVGDSVPVRMFVGEGVAVGIFVGFRVVDRVFFGNCPGVTVGVIVIFFFAVGDEF